MELLPTCHDLSHLPQHKSVGAPEYPPFGDYLKKLFGQVCYQNVRHKSEQGHNILRLLLGERFREG